MRYLGNKNTIVDFIISKLQQHNLLNVGVVFFDALCGTGSVSCAFKNIFNIILNDNLKCASLFSRGVIVESRCKFEKLGFDPFEYFNSNELQIEGFCYKNYAPKISGRMYFSDFNAKRIDYFRYQIEMWKSDNCIDYNEYCYLIASLEESISKVANIAGVYGAYLKKWDSRAIKKIIFKRPNEGVRQKIIENYQAVQLSVEDFNENIEDCISNVPCDILYLDPPYTKNSYSVQYHLLESIVRDDNPILKGRTGARQYDGISNKWSKSYEVEVLFDEIIAKTKARYILFSYSSDGIMSKEYIINTLKRYCYEDSVEMDIIPYKKYRNSHTHGAGEHFEYLFFAQKKVASMVEYCCPLNYMGGKTNVVKYIRPYLFGKKVLIDAFGGGFNVSVNVFKFDSIIYNDINFKVVELIKMFRKEGAVNLLRFLDKTISKYNLVKHGKDAYLRLRKEYNEKLRFSKDAPKYLYVLILYGFQQQIRFNSRYEFNNPIGESGYNDAIKSKIVSFCRRLQEIKCEFLCEDFTNLLDYVNNDTLVYLDPPYLITLGSYNDGKRGFNGWNEECEKRLLWFVDLCHAKGAKVIMSNILEYKGTTNDLLKEWIQNKQVKVIEISVRKRNEVLIVHEA